MADPILFLCCGSNRKLAGGERAYRPTLSMPLAIADRGRELLHARQRVFQHISAGARSIQGTRLRDLPYNGQLVLGPDLGGKATGTYMPATRRYCGRFYQELDPNGLGTLNESHHHWLIVSPLYGLVLAGEQIQRYSCYTLDDKQIPATWTQGWLLTSLLIAYVNQHRVKVIVDLLADPSFRELFNWDRVHRRVRILRAFGEQNAGPGLLPAFGFLARHQWAAMPTKQLLAIDEAKTFRTDYEDVVLTTELYPPAGFLQPSPPKETTPRFDQTPNEIGSPPPTVDAGEHCVILSRARDIPVTSDDHRTIFGHRITHMRDLPPEVRPLFKLISRAAEVLSVRLGRFTARGSTRAFALSLSLPSEGSGVIDGKLTGPGRIGRIQYLRIGVTPGRELATYVATERLRAGEME